MSFDQFLKRWDARYGIPRPASALHLDSFQAGLRLLSDVGKGGAMLAAGVASAFIWWNIADLLQRVGVETHLYMIIVMICCGFISLMEASSLAVPYWRFTQRVTYGSARWAEASELKALAMAIDNREELPQGALRIGRLTRRYDLALPFKQVLCHTAIFGPPGSGKSSSFFMSMAKDWSRRGSAIFLDPKGELFRYTARHFKRVYRLDLADPRLSDRWNFVPPCRGDAELAHEIASIVVGYDANKNLNYDPFWPQAETSLLTSLLLHLPHIVDNPTPAHISEFIAERDFNDINSEMLNSPDHEARVKWGVFKKADREKTQGGIYIGLGTKLDPFRSPHAMAVMQSASAEERERGLREIDLYDLRKPSTGIYVVVPEGDANRYRIVLSILFGLAASVTRKTGDDEGSAPVLLALDEAGNIPLHNLSEALGVGRGRRCGLVLGYQNIGQLYKQHGRDGAQAILGSIGSMIFLPGLDAETSHYAAKRIGRTTVLQHRSVDATGFTYDHEGLTETGRDLIDAAELRQIPEHTQAVAVVGSIPPVKFGFPLFAKVGPQFHPLPREIAPPVTFAEAEASFAARQARESEELNEGASAIADFEVLALDLIPSNHQKDAKAVTEKSVPDNSQANEITVAPPDGLGNDQGNLDALMKSLLDIITPSVERLGTEAGGAPEVHTSSSRIDPDSVFETGALGPLEEPEESVTQHRSAQLTFGWLLDASGEAAETAATNGGQGARR